MSEHLKLGHIITDEQQRDAVHIAVVPVEAGETFRPGEHVGLVLGKAKTLGNHIGVVDPYLRDHVLKGQRFWLFLYPGSITSLRHEWTHPAFPSEGPAISADRAASEAWLRAGAVKYSIDYDRMIEGAVSGDGACFGDDDGPDFTRSADFWMHVEIVTGKRFDQAHRENAYFYCTC